MRKMGYGSMSAVSAMRKSEPIARLVGAVVALFIFPQMALGQSYKVLHAFIGPPDGSGPMALSVDKAGNVYGTTSGGGAVTNTTYCAPYGCGTAYKISAARKESVTYAFAPTGIEMGLEPWGTSLVRDETGNLYGTTLYGGNIGCFQNQGCGTVFKLSSAGKLTVLYRFTGMNGDGVLPSGLTMDAAGNLYGTTQAGGQYSQGTVFKVDTSGNETVLHSFAGYPNDGGGPVVGVALDAGGNLYGTTFFGGTNGSGSIFKVSSTGVESVLYSFPNLGAAGYEAEGSLLVDSKGNIYGTTAQGGNLSCGSGGGCGVVYRVDASGNYSVLYGFTGGTDGANPQTGLAMDAAGNLYGTTRAGGGEAACGTVFKLSSGGTLTPLHAFTGCAEDGVVPFTAPVLDTVGNIYGTALDGGIVKDACQYGCGVVFKIRP